MGYTMINQAQFNIPVIRCWDEETEPCLVLHFDPNVLMYQSLEFRTELESGTYAYAVDIKDLKPLREQLIKLGRFKPTELTFGKIPNIQAILKKEGQKKES